MARVNHKWNARIVQWACHSLILAASLANSGCFLFDSYELQIPLKDDSSIQKEVDITTSGCTDNNSCSNDKPFCVNNQCQQSCTTSAQCQQKFANTLECLNGACVECTTHTQCAAKDSTKPACVENKCVPCTRNFQCTDSACDIGTGKCHDKSKIPYRRVSWCN